MAGGSDYAIPRSARRLLRGVALVSVLFALMGWALWLMGGRGTSSAVGLSDLCPAEYPLLVRIEGRDVCIAGALPRRAGEVAPAR